MVEVIEIKEEKKELFWLPLSEKVFETLDLSIGDWVLMRLTDGGISIEKTETEQITVEMDTELVEKVLMFRDTEGYYTLEEALSNLIRKGLAHLYGGRWGEDRAEKIDNSWLVQIHSS